MKKTMKKIVCGALAAVSVFGCAAMTGCNTAHPEMQMKIEFNGETYKLNYKLYRKIAPATVKHFIWLVDNDYYDGLCIHDYDTAQNRMYTGAYAAGTEDATELVYKKYYETVAGYSNVKKFPHSVWTLEDDDKLPTYTLKGEFEEGNGFTVDNGNLKETFGSLTMYYYSIDDSDVANERVLTSRASDDNIENWWDYQYNHATSAFYISLTETAKSNSGYCTFAKLKSGSKDDLEDLIDAINEYIEDNYEDGETNEFTESIVKNVFEDDPFMKDKAPQNEAFSTPKEPIIIKSMKITKY